MTTQATEHQAVQMARDVLARATDTPVHLRPTMTRPELDSLVHQLTDGLTLLLEYVDLMHERAALTQQIAQHEQSAQETQARIDAQASTASVPGTQVLTTTVTDDEHATIQSLAELAEVDMPTFLRSAALASHGGHVATIAALHERCDKAERSLLEIIHTVKRIADGAR